jgi:hypothetical protein
MRKVIKGITGAQVAIASWGESDEDWITVKGINIAERIAKSGRQEEASVFFFHCDNREQALNLRALYGDGRQKVN